MITQKNNILEHFVYNSRLSNWNLYVIYQNKEANIYVIDE